MELREISTNLCRILSGVYLFTYQDLAYQLIYPGVETKYNAEIYAQREYDQNRFNDWIKPEEVVDVLVDLGLWNYEGDRFLKQTEKEIEAQKVALYKSFLIPKKIKEIKKNIKKLKDKHNKHYGIRHSLDYLTSEGYIELVKNQYLLINSLFDSSGHKIFRSIDTTDSTAMGNLSAIIAAEIISIESFKEISRSDIWKSYWSANKERLFDKPTVDWTDEQKTLVVLTKMYDSAYEHPECPPEDVFLDDDMFDGWMLCQKEENDKNKQKSRAEKMLEGKNIGKAGEVFLVANSKEEAQNIYSLNSATNTHIIKERAQAVEKYGQIDDINLPDVQRNLFIQQNNERKNR